MASIDSVVEAIDKFIDSKLDVILGNNPILNLAQPFIKKGINKYMDPYRDTIKLYLTLIADKDDMIDLDENFNMITDRFNTMPESTVHNNMIGDITMGKGKIQFEVPMPFGPKKLLIFTANDITDFKSMIKQH